MSVWLMAEIVVVVLLCVALFFRARLGDRFQRVSMACCALLVVIATMESLVDQVHPWTIALGAIALIVFAIEFVRQSRRSAARLE